MNIPYFQFGKGKKKLCFVSGVHGIENTSIQIAFELIKYLKKVRLNYQVGILPLVNIAGALKESRVNPVDNKDINSSFGEDEPVSSSDKIAQYIWNIAREYEWIIDLHSAGYARYLPHVIIYEYSVIEDVRYFGFPFIIKRNGVKKGKGNSLLAIAAKKSKKACVLELGGGQTVFLDDVNNGMRSIIQFLNHLDIVRDIQKDKLILTGMNQVFLKDYRVINKVSKDGILFFRKRLGDKVHEDTIIAELLDIEKYESKTLKSSVSGRVIYTRTRNNIHSGETAFMILVERR